MSMVIQHNLNAVNAMDRLHANVVGLKGVSEKLASGYRINRAGDDAAGLAVSEKMRSSLRGLTQSIRNGQDGISMIQTFEGALNEVGEMIQRARALAEESANGTYMDSVDRAAIELEYLQILDEIDQISETDFNGMVMLTGGRDFIDKLKLKSDYEEPPGFEIPDFTTNSRSAAVPSTTSLSELPAAPVTAAATPMAVSGLDSRRVYTEEIDLSSMTYWRSITSGGVYRIYGTGTWGIKINTTANVTLVLDNATINSNNGAAITCSGAGKNLNIVLEDGTTNQMKGDSYFAGIQVTNGATVTIDGTGELNAVGGSDSAGIGASWFMATDDGRTVGNIIINGGTINATGNGTAAAIGSASASKSGDLNNVGSIKITGGNITTNGTIGSSSSASSVKYKIMLDGNAIIRANTFRGLIDGSTTVQTKASTNMTGNFIGIDATTCKIHGNVALDDKLDYTGRTLDQSSGTITRGYATNGIINDFYGNYTLTENVDVPASGEFNVHEGASVTVAQGVTVNNAGTMNIEGNLYNRGTVINTNDMEVSGSFSGNGTFTNSGTVNAEGNVSNSGTTNNSGEINSSGSLSFSGNTVNSGDINAEGSLSLGGNTANSGNMTANGALNNSGTLSNTGEINARDNFSNRGTINNSGELNSSEMLVNTGTINNNDTFNNTGTIQNYGTINNAADFDNSRNILNLGTINNNGNYNNGGFLENEGTLSNNGTLDNSGGVINNVDTFNNSESGTVENTSGTFVNRSKKYNNPGTLNGKIYDLVNIPQSMRLSQGEAKFTFVDSLDLCMGSRTKDLVNYTFEYTKSDSMGYLKNDLDCTALGLGMTGLSLATQESANKAIDGLDNAMNKISMIRATFGSVQNRISHKIDNITVTKENITDAESSIRDTDMASEMMNYIKFDILRQASYTLLAQANKQPQSIVQLLE